MRCGAYSALTTANTDTRAQHRPYVYAPGSRHRYVRDSAHVCQQERFQVSLFNFFQISKVKA